MAEIVYKAYLKRYLLLAILCFVTFWQIYSTNGFIILNNAVTMFYQITPYVTDLLAVIGHLIGLPVGLLSAYYSDALSLRAMMLGLILALLGGSLVCMIGFLSGDLFYVTAIGRLITSSTFGVMFTTQVLLAAGWFPFNETAMAFSFPLMTAIGGSIASSVIYPLAIPTLNFTKTTNNSEWEGSHRVTVVFSTTFGSMCISSLLSLILAIIYCKNNPPSPPSRAQHEILLETEKRSRKCCIDRLKSIRSIVGKRQFVLITVATSFFHSYLVYRMILMPSCILTTFPEIENIVPGKIFLISTIGQVAGVTVAGKLLDRFKTFMKTVLISVIIMVLSCVGLFFAHSRRKMTLLYILYTTINTAGGVYMPSAIELLVETTYPANKLLLMSLYTSISNTFIVIFTSITRLMMTKLGVPTATLATAGFLMISMVAILMINPDYKRHKMDTTTLNGKGRNEELNEMNDRRLI